MQVFGIGLRELMKTQAHTEGVAANRRPAGQSDGSDNLSAAVAADRAFPAVVAEFGSFGKIFVSDCSHPQRKSVWPNI